MATDKTRTITLTGRPPVKIRESEWPVIAQADDSDDHVHPHQANRTWWIIVRRHADGRAIVYGGHESNWQGSRDRRAGNLLVAGENIADAIYRVVESLSANRIMAEDCIAGLPAEEI